MPNNQPSSIAIDVNVHALIVAAGKGSRFIAQMSAYNQQPEAHSLLAKQYVSIADKTVVQHSVEKLAASQYIEHCYLVIAKDDTTAVSLDWALPMTLVTGGAERWNSVQAGIDAIIRSGADDMDLVVIHDAARPCVQIEDINQVIAVANGEDYGAILAVPVADTLKKVDEAYQIEQTVDRAGLWQAQTPQVFRLGYLQQVLQEVAKQGIHITDEASAFEQLGYAIKLVQGSRSNLKLTYADDLPLVQALLELYSQA